MSVNTAVSESTWHIVGRVSEPDVRARSVDVYQASTRSWDGFTLRDNRFSGGPGMIKPASSNERMRVFVVTERIGGPLEAREVPTRSSYEIAAWPVGFAPSGCEAWTYSEQGGEYQIGSLAFDADALEHKLLEGVDRQALLEPKLCFSNERMHWIARNLLRESAHPSELSGLYSDSLLVLFLIEFLRVRRGDERKLGGLTRTQLTRVIEHIDGNLMGQVRLAELAALTGFSVSHFCHAFRASTGVPPHRWQLQARIHKAQRMMLDREQPLASIAVASGFADQSHFTRTFRRLVGITPTKWLKERPAPTSIHDLASNRPENEHSQRHS